MHDTHRRGCVAEAAVALAAMKAGIVVLRPLTDGARYDLALDIGGRILRVQCKAAARYEDVIVVRCRSGRRTREGVVMRRYTRNEIDAFAAYCAEVEQCYFLPIEMFDDRAAVQLRLEPTKNNQRAGINWAKDYEFAARLGARGAVAQLGERLAGSQKATGSSPVGSTDQLHLLR